MALRGWGRADLYKALFISDCQLPRISTPKGFVEGIELDRSKDRKLVRVINVEGEVISYTSEGEEHLTDPFEYMRLSPTLERQVRGRLVEWWPGQWIGRNWYCPSYPFGKVGTPKHSVEVLVIGEEIYCPTHRRRMYLATYPSEDRDRILKCPKKNCWTSVYGGN